MRQKDKSILRHRNSVDILSYLKTRRKVESGERDGRDYYIWNKWWYNVQDSSENSGLEQRPGISHSLPWSHSYSRSLLYRANKKRERSYREASQSNRHTH